MKYFFLTIISVIASYTFSQRTFEKDGIKIETRLEKVTDQSARNIGYEYEVLTITNTHNTTKTVTFHHDTYYGSDYCWTCENSEYTYTFKLKANETLVGQLNGSEKGLTVFVKDHTGAIKEVLSDLRFSKFEVK
jgi:hypothetical protein